MRIAHLFEAPANILNNPQFTSWFGNSKMRNADGTPMVFYHGTSEQPDGGAISTFKRSDDGLLGPGVYFTPARDYAGSYATKEQGYVMPCYLRINNPLVIEFHEDGQEVVFRIGKALEDCFLNSSRGWARRQWEDYSGIGDEEFIDMLKGEGYDGVVLKKGNEIVELTVISPYQIKSAVGNYGNFSTRSAGVHESA